MNSNRTFTIIRLIEKRIDDRLMSSSNWLINYISNKIPSERKPRLSIQLRFLWWQHGNEALLQVIAALSQSSDIWRYLRKQISIVGPILVKIIYSAALYNPHIFNLLHNRVCVSCVLVLFYCSSKYLMRSNCIITDILMFTKFALAQPVRTKNRNILNLYNNSFFRCLIICLLFLNCTSSNQFISLIFNAIQWTIGYFVRSNSKTVFLKNVPDFQLFNKTI